MEVWGRKVKNKLIQTPSSSDYLTPFLSQLPTSSSVFELTAAASFNPASPQNQQRRSPKTRQNQQRTQTQLQTSVVVPVAPPPSNRQCRPASVLIQRCLLKNQQRSSSDTTSLDVAVLPLKTDLKSIQIFIHFLSSMFSHVLPNRRSDNIFSSVLSLPDFSSHSNGA